MSIEGGPVNLLTLDGGGIRGICELMVLHEIMMRVKKHRRLVAILLSRFKLTTKDAIEIYCGFSRTIFSRKNRKIGWLYLLGSHEFRPEALEEIVKELVISRAVGEHMLDPESSTLSKAFVCSQLAYNQGIPVRFRTYEPPSAKKIASPSPVSLHPSISSALSPSSTSLLPSPPIDLSPSPSLLFSNPVNRLPYSPLLLCSPLVDSLPIVSLPENDSVVPTSAVPADPWNEYRDIRIWEAARATTAAPSYFPPMGIIRGNEKRTFIDGAMGCNNPSLELVDEATALYGTGRVLGCLISLGTGFSGPLTIGTRKGPGRFWDLIKNIKRLSSDPESVHLGMESQIRPELNTYSRFQLPNGAESIGLHQYKKLDKLSRFMEKYIQDESSEITRSDHGQISTLRKHTPHWIPSNEYTTRPDFMNTLRGLSRRHRLESADSSLRLPWYFARLWTSQDAALPRIYEGIFEKWYSATY